MMAKKKLKLNDQHKMFIVQRLACFDTPTSVAESMKEEFGLEVGTQTIHHYDPTKKSSPNLSQKWRDLFDATRKEFLDHVSMYVPGAHKAVRVKKLWNAAQAFERKGNYVAMADMMERIAKEIGGAFTNRREFSGRDGKPIEFADMTEEQLDARLMAFLRGAGMSAESGDEADAGGSDSVH